MQTNTRQHVEQCECVTFGSDLLCDRVRKCSVDKHFMSRDLDSELIKDEEDFSDMHPDDKNIASDAEIEASRFLKSECELEDTTKIETDYSDKHQKEVSSNLH